MPKVFAEVHHECAEPAYGWNEFFRLLGHNLPIGVAEALTCDDEGGTLTKDDVKVNCRITDPKRDFGSGKCHLEITILANDYASRRQDLPQRRAKILEDLSLYLPNGLRISVWIFLGYGDFGEFET